MKKLVLCVLLLGVSLLVGCGGSGGSSSSGGGTTVTLVAIQVTPATPTINAGATQQFKATGAYSDGSTKDLTATANWLSSSTTVATVNTSGLATGVSAGTSTITASSGTISGNTVLTVANPLISIAVTASTLSIAVNSQLQFTATGTYADASTKDLTTTATWQSSNSGIATISATGLAAGIAPGSVTITATSGSVSGTATLSVTNPLVSIAVTPVTQSLPTGGFNQQFTATGTYADGTTNVITSSVTWASSNTAFATISNSPGTQGQATSVAPGTTQITATSGSITSPPATLTVISATLVSIEVTAPSSSLSLLDQQQYKATGTFTPSISLPPDITSSVTWMSSDPAKVKIVGSGFATGLKVTSTPVMITASKGAVTSNPPASVTVDASNLESIAITPGSTILAQGTSRLYAATGTLKSGSTLNISDQVTWTSSHTTIAMVGATGLVTAAASVSLASNPVMITAALSPAPSQTVNLTVTNATVNSITVTPITASIPVGAGQSFTATASFSDSTTQDVSSNASWVSSDTSKATVSGGGAFGISPTPVGPPAMPVTITATFGGQHNAAQLTVTDATLTSISVTPATTNLTPGSTVTYQAQGHYSVGPPKYLTGVTWTSTVPTVVMVTPVGVATGQSAGTATITAKYQGVTSNTASVLVTASPLASIAVLPLTASVPEAVATQFTATGTFVDGSTQDLTTNVTWASSPSSVATISNALTPQGVATGVAPGTASITAVFASQTGTATLNVTTATLQSISVIPSNPIVTHGSTQGFTATGKFSDGSTVNLTNQVTWTSSDVTVATISSTGQASTVKAGSVTITASLTQNGKTVSGTALLTVN